MLAFIRKYNWLRRAAIICYLPVFLAAWVFLAAASAAQTAVADFRLEFRKLRENVRMAWGK